MMQIQVLGTVDVVEPAGVALGGPTQRRVLSALLLRANQVVSVDQLVDSVWPHDRTPERAEHNVRTYVHRLRTALGGAGDRIETAGTGYRFRVEPHELDARRFEDLVDQARKLANEGGTVPALQLLDEALGLWRGRPFEEFADEEWARAEVTRLGEVRASAIEHRFAAMLDAGRHTEVVGPLRDAVTEEPWREARQMQLALALYRSGRQAEALRAIHLYKSELTDEVGLLPSPELDRLEHQILDHDPTLLPASHRQRVLRDYQLDEVIGEGAFSLVWRGTQPSLGRKVAIKQIRAELANQPDFVRRFETEAQTVAALEHPHIVPLYDYWREPDSAYLVMRYVAGGSLESEVLARRLDEDRLRRLVRQVGSALHTAHGVGVIHRDVKSANVVVDAEGNFYLTDFGIAFTGSASSDVLATALSTGSPAYASPEQLRREPLDSRTDVYGFGITLFEAATGRLPFIDASTQAELVRRQLEDPVPAPSSVTSGLAVWVDQLIARATAKDPDDRFGSMAELMAAVPDRGADLDDRGDRVAVAPEVGDLVNPFKALSAFREVDAADFHGRDRLIARFVDVLDRPGSAGRLLAVVGPSGSGKSSAVRSGLLPRLRTGAVAGSDGWFITTMLPGSHPFDELESSLSRVAVRQPGPLVEVMRGDDHGIARAINQTLPDSDSELLLVIDQFEEVFTHATQAERTKFLDGLLAAVQEPRTRLRVVLTIRADFLDGPLRHPQLAARLETATVTVSPLAADELEAAIIEPVHRQGASYEPGLVARIMADVGDQPGALPLLQYALTELFDANVSGLLQAESYDAIGGLAGALATRADETLIAMTTGQQAVARRLFGRLVTLGDGTDDTRRRVKRRELGDHPDMITVIDTFGAARLLVFDHDPATREPTVEVAHEALLHAWPRLRNWLDDDRDDLRTLSGVGVATESWLASDRDDGELARGGRLEIVGELAARRADVLNDSESEWITASQVAAAAAEQTRTEAALRDRRQNRRLRGLLVGVGLLLAVALVAGTLAVRQQRRADDQAAAARESAAEAERQTGIADDESEAARESAAEAERQTGIAEEEAVAARESAAEAERQAEIAVTAVEEADLATLISRSAAQSADNPELSVLLALDAHRRSPEPATEQAVLNALGSSRISNRIATFPGIEEGGCEAPIFHSQDGLSASAHVGGQLVILDLTTGQVSEHGQPDQECGVWLGDPESRRSVAGNLGGDRYWVGTFDDPYAIELEQTGQMWLIATDLASNVAAFRFDRGTRSGLDTPMILFDATTGEQIGDPIGEGALYAMSADPSGSFVAFSYGDPEEGGFRGRILIVDAETGDELFDIDSDATAASFAFDPTTPKLTAGRLDGTIRTIDLVTGETDSVVATAATSEVFEVGVLPDGLIAAVSRGRIQVIDRLSGPTDVVIELRDVGRARVRADGSVVTQSFDGDYEVIELEGSALVERSWPVDAFSRVTFKDGRAGLVSLADRDASIVDLTTGEHTAVTLLGPDGTRFDPFAVIPEPDGFWGVTAGGAVARWQGDTVVEQFEFPGRLQSGAGFGGVIASRGIYADGSLFASLANLEHDPTGIVFTVPAPDGKLAHPALDGGLHVVDEDGTLHSYDANGVITGEFETGVNQPDSVRMEATTGVLGLISNPGVVAVVDPVTGEVDEIPGNGLVADIGFARDGQLLVIAGWDGAVRVWDLERGEPAGLVWNGSGVSEFSSTWYDPSSDSMWIFTSGRLLQVPLDPQRWVQRACEIVGRDLTQDEWDRYVPGDDAPQSACT